LLQWSQSGQIDAGEQQIALQDKVNMDKNTFTYHHETTDRKTGQKISVIDFKVTVMEQDGPTFALTSKSNLFSKPADFDLRLS